MSDEEEFEEIERIVLGLDEPDSDLYDRVAYLDMVKEHQLARKRKFRSMANLQIGGGSEQEATPGVTLTLSPSENRALSDLQQQRQSNPHISLSPTTTTGQQHHLQKRSVQQQHQQQRSPIRQQQRGSRHQSPLQQPQLQLTPRSNYASAERLSIQISEHPAEQPLLGAEPPIAVGAVDESVDLPSICLTKSPRSPRLSLVERNAINPVRIIAGDVGDGQQPSPPSPMSRERQEYEIGMGDPQIRQIWTEAVDLSEIRNVDDQTEFRSLRVQLGIDKISSETLSHYNVKGHMDNFDHPAICYPRYRGLSSRHRIPNGVKLIRRVGDKLVKENYPETDKFRFSGMFGLHMITQFDNRIVLCTNERDALAVYDASNGIPALSLPQGERFDPTVIPYLEDFDLIYIWFPHIHERFAKDYASYLNAAKCYIITAPLRPVELVRDNRTKEVLHSIQDAVRVRYKGFRSVQDLRDSVRSEIVQSKSRLTGITLWKRYALLNNYMRGFRPSELTVISAGGGHGKTTFMCEYAMDLYTQGVRTLFCNFEMPEEKTLKWMIIQFAGIPLQQRQEHSSVEMWLDRFERTHSDLMMMKTEEFCDKTLKEIADSIREQTLACGTQHLVIDNLQALVDMATTHIDTMTVAERTHQQDRFVGMLRRMANIQELHITLVVHPIKEPNEFGYYELHHIGGPSAKITQESDNVLVIQRRRDMDDRRKFRKFLYILKNRFGGRCVEVDQIEMIFQPSTMIHTLVEVTK